MGLSRRCRGSLDNYRRNIGVGIGIKRRGIPIPSRTYDPPPAEPIPMPAMKPTTAAPNDDVVFMKVVDVAPPNRSRPRLTNGRQCDSHQYNRQQSQN